ncbi:MAG: hypothetical protein A4E28_00075 [Methanocella sp. PtaU1.Bin125]|nr:MAG: hypothetical protein A4E28_00075 [Methanocella sp. PtaU1.Bin125]
MIKRGIYMKTLPFLCLLFYVTGHKEKHKRIVVQGYRMTDQYTVSRLLPFRLFIGPVFRLIYYIN